MSRAVASVAAASGAYRSWNLAAAISSPMVEARPASAMTSMAAPAALTTVGRDWGTGCAIDPPGAWSV
jgi:hypothetical protein